MISHKNNKDNVFCLNPGEAAVIFKRDGEVKLELNLDKKDPDLTEPSLVVAATLSYLATHNQEWLEAAIDLFMEMKIYKGDLDDVEVKKD